MTRFKGIELLLQDGDIIISKKGILFKDPLVEGTGQVVHKVKFEGKSFVVMESDKYPREFVDMRKID
jgi:hypothetical protein